MAKSRKNKPEVDEVPFGDLRLPPPSDPGLFTNIHADADRHARAYTRAVDSGDWADYLDEWGTVVEVC